ncbi:hypothetical protein BH09PSE3_BH09PSE3_00310 [soil metagenome]
MGVVDRDPAAALRFQKRFGHVRMEGTIAAMLATEPFDVAHICTPADDHVSVAIELAAAHKHSLIEKPLSETAAEARLVAAAFDHSGSLVCPVHQYAFQRGVDKAIEIMPRLGFINRIAFDIVSAGGGRDEGSFDNIAGEILPHPLSMLQRLYPTIRLSDLDWRVVRSGPGEWLVTSTHEHAMIVISTSLASRPTNFSTRISGTQCAIEMNNFHGYAVSLSGVVSRFAKILQPFVTAERHLVAATANLIGRAARGEMAYPGLRALVGRFYDAVLHRDAARVPVTTSQMIDLADAREAILQQVGRSHQ